MAFYTRPAPLGDPSLHAKKLTTTAGIMSKKTLSESDIFLAPKLQLGNEYNLPSNGYN